MSKQSVLNPKLAKLHTSCKPCIFASFENTLQTDCKLGLITKYREKNFEVLEAEDDTSQFYIINDKQCLLKRTKNWKHYNNDLNKQKKLAYKECEIKYQTIVYNNKGIDEIKTTCDSLINQTLKPKHISIINSVDNNIINRQELIHYLNSLKIKWRLQNVTDEDLSEERSLNILLKICSFPYLSIFYSGFKIPFNTFYEINRFINEDMNYFVAILPNSEKQGMVISYMIYQAYQKTILANFENYLNNYKDSTYNIHDIVPQFPV